MILEPITPDFGVKLAQSAFAPSLSFGELFMMQTITKLALDMAMIELVDFNEIYNADKQPKKKTTRRSRRGGAAKAVAAVETTTTTEEE